MTDTSLNYLRRHDLKPGDRVLYTPLGGSDRALEGTVTTTLGLYTCIIEVPAPSVPGAPETTRSINAPYNRLTLVEPAPEPKLDPMTCDCGSVDKYGDDLGEHSQTCPYHLEALRRFGPLPEPGDRTPHIALSKGEAELVVEAFDSIRHEWGTLESKESELETRLKAFIGE